MRSPGPEGSARQQGGNYAGGDLKGEPRFPFNAYSISTLYLFAPCTLTLLRPVMGRLIEYVAALRVEVPRNYCLTDFNA